MLVSDFDFHLPDELIAQEPAPRGQSRLLVLDRATGARRHTTIQNLPEFLRPGDLLVANNTRVFAARLLGHRVPSGGAVECLLLGRAERPELEGDVWEALMHPGQKLKPGMRFRFDGPAGVLEGEVLERHFYGRRTIRLGTGTFFGKSPGTGTFSDQVLTGKIPVPGKKVPVPNGAVPPKKVPVPNLVDELIDALGHTPLPPYIKRPDTPADRERYQTVFARVPGSVAAPTAGLHFTPALLDALERRRVERTEITLHVGYGTFKPVRTDLVEEHVVDPEHYEIGAAAAAAIARARGDQRRVVAVGTTTTRALEDAALRGGGTLCAGRATASLFIHPGFEFRVIGALLTNFHLPRSSLLMLVAAFAGRDAILAAYREAVERRYRFYSYGDAMLICDGVA